MESHWPWNVNRAHLGIAANVLVVIVAFIVHWPTSFLETLLVTIFSGLSAVALAVSVSLARASHKPEPEPQAQPQQPPQQDRPTDDLPYRTDTDAVREARATARVKLLKLVGAFESNLASVLEFVSSTSSRAQGSASTLTAAAQEASSLAAAAGQISNESFRH